MSKKLLLLTACCILLAANSFAQAPEKFNYQGVARDNSGNILASQNIGLRLSLHSSSPVGPIVYQETFDLNTNTFGLFSIEIGGGTWVSGVFAAINWGTASYYVQTEMDATGGTQYQSLGAAQLLSVPYALYAKTSGATVPDSYPVDTIGQPAHGGIVFYVDETGHHGLVCAIDDQHTAIGWINNGIGFRGTTGDGCYAGEMNTTVIVATDLPGNGFNYYAAQVCADYQSAGNAGSGSYGDWYLPSKWEMNMLFMKSSVVNAACVLVGGAAIAYLPDAYWTSTEVDDANAYANNPAGPFLNTWSPTLKTDQRRVRAIRKF
jgi:hypothetical protein